MTLLLCSHRRGPSLAAGASRISQAMRLNSQTPPVWVREHVMKLQSGINRLLR